VSTCRNRSTFARPEAEEWTEPASAVRSYREHRIQRYNEEGTLKTRFGSLLFLGVLVAVSLSAATKTSGTAMCKSDPASPPPVAVSDTPSHAFAVGKAQCTWTGFSVAGQQYKDGVSVSLGEIAGDTNSYHGYHVATTTTGDRSVSKFQGSGKLKDGKTVSETGTWTLTSGTGKLKGITGKGTYTGTANADGSMTYKVDGEYSLP
jgi:hypothetical protein